MTFHKSFTKIHSTVKVIVCKNLLYTSTAKIHLLWSRPVLAVRYRYTIVSHSALVIKINFLCKLCSILAYWWQLLCFANFNVHDEFQLNLNSLRSHNNRSILTVDLFPFKVSNWYLSTESRYQYPNSPKFFHNFVFLSKILEKYKAF